MKSSRWLTLDTKTVDFDGQLLSTVLLEMIRWNAENVLNVEVYFVNIGNNADRSVWFGSITYVDKK